MIFPIPKCVVLILYIVQSCNGSENGPDINLYLTTSNYSEIHLMVTPSNNTLTIHRHQNVIHIRVTCSANFPIFWMFDGPQTNTPANARTFSIRSSDNNRFKSNFNMVPVEQASGYYRCGGIHNQSETSSFHLYLPPDTEESIEEYYPNTTVVAAVRPNHSTPVVLYYPFLNESSIRLTRAIPTTSPPVSWEVFTRVSITHSFTDSQMENSSQTVNTNHKTSNLSPHYKYVEMTRGIDYEYSFYSGFQIKTYEYGQNVLLIRHQWQSVDPIYVTINIVSHLDVFPKDELVNLSRNASQDQFNFNCSSDLLIKELLIKQGKRVDNHKCENSPISSSYTCSYPADLVYRPYGTIECIGTQMSSDVTLHTWKYMSEDLITFYYRLDEIHCLTSESKLKSNIKIINLQCGSNDECRLREKCLLDTKKIPDGCGSIIKHEEPALEGRIIRHRYEAGIVKCFHSDGFMKQETYFTGLRMPNGSKNLIKYSDWKTTEISNLISLRYVNEQLGNTIYTNQYRTFECRVINFVFNDPPRWAYEDSDGQVLPFPTEHINITRALVETFDDRDKAYYYYRFGRIRFFTPNIKKIVCRASCQDSWDWMNNSLPVNVEDSMSPTFSEKSGTVTEVIFTPRDTLQLECYPKAKPKAVITWKYNNSMPLPTRLQKFEDRTRSTIYFPEHSSSFNGLYSCHAKNVAGKDSKSFQVKFKASRDLTLLWVSLCIGGLVILFIMGFLLVILRNTKKALKELSDDDFNEFMRGIPELAARVGMGNEFAYYLPYENSPYEIPRNKFDFGLDCLIGSGNFGLIFKAKYLLENSPYKYVAVKTLKPFSDINYFKSLLKELKTMIYIGNHENVVTLVGACTENLKKREIYILMEFCSNGSLLSYVQKFERHYVDENCVAVTTKQHGVIIEQCVQFSIQVVKGLQFLKEKHIIHGDLAARNVLVTENLVAKIADFGLSRQLLNYENYIQNKKDCCIPWRWVAIEALQFQKFSHESDIWSYGVLLWEVFSFGQIPFSHLVYNDEFLMQISEGYRLNKPTFCPPLIYNNIMLECWRIEPWNRIQLGNVQEHLLHYYSASTVSSNEYTVLECKNA